MRHPVLALCVLFQGISPHALSAQAAQPGPALEEVTVTAQKRAQGLQDVPLAITALSAENIADQNIYDILDLERAVPSLKVIAGYNRANGTPVIIRGMGTLAAQPAFEGSVGTYIDGVYRSRPGMVLSSMLDVGRIDVLRGPQGTLFGKNTTAGALSISSNEPSMDLGYAGEVTVGEYDRRRFAGHVTGPLGDTVAGRLAVLSDQRDGFTEAVFDHDDYGDLNAEAVRLSLNWDASETLAVKFIADYSESDEVCCFGNPVPYKRDDSLTDGQFTDYNREAAMANFNTDIDLINLDPRDRRSQNNLQPSNETKDKGLVLDVSWETGYGQWRSITGWRDWQYTSGGDFDFGPVDIGELLEDYDVDSYSQELTLSGSFGEPGKLGSIEYATGLFYAFEDFEQLRRFDAGPDQAGIWEIFWPAQAGAPEPLLRELLGGGEWATDGGTIGDVLHNLETETMAAFAHVTVSLTEQLSMIIGLRYTDEEKTLDRYNLLFDDVGNYSTYLQENMLGGWVLGANIAGPDIVDLTYSDSEWTYDIKFQYFLDEDTQLYGGYSRGFKAGGIGMDPEAGGGQPSGQNSALIQQLLGMGNGTGFADMEDPTYEPEYIDALELGLKKEFLSGRGRINAALFYNEIEDIQFSVFTGTGFRVENASSAEVAGLELESSFAVSERLLLGVSLTYLDTEYGDDIPEPAPPGRDLTHAPQWAGVVNLGYEYPLSVALMGFVNANWSYRDKTFIAYDNQDQQSAYNLFGLQLGLRSSLGEGGGTWDLRAWCSNCLDEDVATAYFNAPFYFDDNLEQYTGQFLAPPRTYGVTLRLDF